MWRWLRSLLTRSLLALFLLLLAWTAVRWGGAPGRAAREGIARLLQEEYPVGEVWTRVGDYLGSGSGLDVRVMGPATEENLSEKNLPDLPVTGELARGFGWQRDSRGWPRFYQGIELKVQPGSPVRSVLAGRVSRVAEDRSLGRVVIIQHEGNLASLYGRLGEVGVRQDQEVAQGQLLGRVSGSYFHFELKDGDLLVDPVQHLQQD